MGRIRRAVPIAAFLIWAVLIGAGRLHKAQRGGIEPVGYRTYQRAAAALARGASPYQTPAQSRALWRSYHRLEAAIRAGQTLRAAGSNPSTRTPPGPYLYLPTLALLVWQLHLTAVPWEMLDLACVVAFPLLLLRWARASRWWLLLAAGSWDVWSTYSGGNVEAILLAGTLVVARLLWPPRPLGRATVPLAAVLVAFVPWCAPHAHPFLNGPRSAGPTVRTPASGPGTAQVRGGSYSSLAPRRRPAPGPAPRSPDPRCLRPRPATPGCAPAR